MKTNGMRGVACALLATLALMVISVQAEPGPTAQVRVAATVEGSTVRIEAKGSAPFEYTTYRPSENLFVVDLVGVAPAASSGARVLRSEIVSSYRVLQYRSGDRAIVRLEVLMHTPVEPRVERSSAEELAVFFEGPPAAPSAQPAAPIASSKVTSKPLTPTPVALRTAAPGTPRVATLIHDVKVDRAEEQTQVRILANGRLSYEALRLSNPERLVLDFSGTRIRANQKSMATSLSPVRGIRMGQFKPEISRVVIDLEKGIPYSVSTESDGVTVAFGVATIKQAAPVVPVRALVASKPEVEPPVVASAPPAPEAVLSAAVVAKEEPKPSAPPSKPSEMALPDTLTQPAAGLASPAPQKAAANNPSVASNSAPAMSSTPGVAAAQQKYSGEPISVNFKDVDLKDFFRLIHEISGLNVVVDPAVRGTLTIVLDDVPWDQALDIALRNNNLDKQLDGNVLRIATKTTLKKEAEDKRDLAKAEAEAVEMDTRTRVLSYAKAKDMRDTLKRFLSPRGEILADERSNMLIIRDIPIVFPRLIALMDQLDRKSQQVEIEARVVAASRSFSREVGTQFGFTTSAAGGRTVFGGLVGRSGFTSPIERGTGLPPPPLVSSGSNSIPLNTNLGANAPTSGASFAHSSPNLAIDFIISAAEAKGVGKLLSKPKVITQNNVKATVKQGTKIPVQTVVNNTIAVQFIDAVLKLEVTPQITAEGTVFMEVVVENTAIDEGIPRVLGIPALNTQSAETTVLIGDGGTVVIGGVIVSSQRTDITQVPLIGSIPLIGHLFKHTSVQSTSQELLFFLTPRIVPN